MRPDALSIAVGCFEVIFGMLLLLYGLRGNAYEGQSLTGRLLTRYFAPTGLWFILAAAFHLLNRRVPDTLLVTLAAICFVAICVWGIEIHRTFKAHSLELAKEREHLKS